MSVVSAALIAASSAGWSFLTTIPAFWAVPAKSTYPAILMSAASGDLVDPCLGVQDALGAGRPQGR